MDGSAFRRLEKGFRAIYWACIGLIVLCFGMLAYVAVSWWTAPKPHWLDVQINHKWHTVEGQFRSLDDCLQFQNFVARLVFPMHESNSGIEAIGCRSIRRDEST